jgi:hypothetical protein
VHSTSALRSSGGGGLPASAVARAGLRPSADAAGVGGRTMEDHPWSGLEERPADGSEPTYPSGCGVDVSEVDSPRSGRDGSTQAARGSYGRSPSGGRRCGSCRRLSRGFGPGSSAGTRRTRPDRSIRAITRRRPSCRRTPTVPSERTPRTGPPTITATDSSVVGQWEGDHRSRPDAGSPPPGGRLAPRGASAAGRSRDLVPGGELSRVGALKGRRTSWEGVRGATGRRRPDPRSDRFRIVGP